MPTSAEHVLLDTSAAVALVSAANPFHASALRRVGDCTRGLAGHAYAEFVSVVTRLPPPFRVSGEEALELLRANFPESRFLGEPALPDVMATLVTAGIVGGAVYDGLIGAAAHAHGLLLVSADHRATATYTRLGVDFELLRSA